LGKAAYTAFVHEFLTNGDVPNATFIERVGSQARMAVKVAAPV